MLGIVAYNTLTAYILLGIVAHNTFSCINSQREKAESHHSLEIYHISYETVIQL